MKSGKKLINKIFIGLSALSFAGTIVSAVFYFIYRSRVNSVEFIKVAVNSVKKADSMLNTASALGWLTIILLILTLAVITVTIVLIVTGRKKSAGNNTLSYDNVQ